MVTKIVTAGHRMSDPRDFDHAAYRAAELRLHEAAVEYARVGGGVALSNLAGVAREYAKATPALTDADRQVGDVDLIGHIAADLRSLVTALRTVLGLHKRVEIPGIEPRVLCEECTDEDFVDYPCPTIQAIQKEML